MSWPAVPSVRVFPGKCSLALSFLFFFPSLWLSHRLGFYITLAPSDCPQGLQAQSFPLRNAARASLFSPRLLVADASVWAISTASCSYVHNLWALFIYLFFFLVMWPSEIPKLCTDMPVRGFPGVWILLLFYDSLPGTGLHPYLFCLSFYLLYFVLPPFEDNGLPVWLPCVLRQCSEVVLWYLLSIQMIFG